MPVFRDFPAAVIKYSLHVTGIPIRDVRRDFFMAIMGGINDWQGIIMMDFGAGQFIWRLDNARPEHGYVAASDSRRDGLAAGF